MRRWLVPAVFGTAAIVTAMHAVDSLVGSSAHPSARTALIALYLALRTVVAVAFTVFTVGRPQPHERARQPLAIAACVVAMGAVLAISAPTSGTPLAFVLSGDAIAVLACLWVVASVLALGRCFGVLPEARGLVTRGPYRFVRHPLYLGEIAACSGLALAAPSASNGAVLACFVIAQAIRMRLEERALSSAFPEYRAYASKTPRLVPGPLTRALAGRPLETVFGDRVLRLGSPSSSLAERKIQP